MTRVLGVRMLAAGNIFARTPVVRLSIAEADPLDAGRARAIAAAIPSGTLRRRDRLAFPAWARLAETYLPVDAARAIEALALLFQRWLTWPVSVSAGEGAAAVFETRQAEAGITAGAAAVAFLEATRTLPEERLAQALRAALDAHFTRTAETTPNADTLAIAQRLESRGISWTPVPAHRSVRLGQGRHAHMIRGSETSRTSGVGILLAQSKSVSNAILRAAGLPVPRQRTAWNEAEALAAARGIGFPVVVKPANANMGRGVSVGVEDAAALAAAFAAARAIEREIVVESMIPGEEHRLLVVDGRFFAAIRHRAAHVTGDGTSTVAALVARENRSPERHGGLHVDLAPIRRDDAAASCLAEQGLSWTSVPAEGQVVRLRRAANVAQGGTAIDVTAEVHPVNRRVAERAALAFGLDVCGVDLITPDIRLACTETGGAICEVNSRPALNLHLGVVEGTVHDAAAAVATSLFPEGARARVPIVAVVRPEGEAGIETALRGAGASAGLGIGIAGPGRFGDGRAAVEALLWDGTLDGAVVVATPEHIVRHGIGLDRVDLAVLPHAPHAAADAAATRIADGRTVRAGDPAALGRALAALGIPATARAPLAPVAATARAAERGVLLGGDIGFGEAYPIYPGLEPARRRLAVDGHGASFAGLSPLLDAADLVVGGLAVPLAATPDPALADAKSRLQWCEPEETLAALGEARLAAVSLANSHALDCGAGGLAATLGALERAGIGAFGAGRDLEAASAPWVRTVAAGTARHTLVMFGAFERRPRYEQPFRWYATPARPGVAPIDPDAIAQRIAALRGTVPAPLFVAFLHWGAEYAAIRPYQRDLAARLAAAGVDLVVGHGAHVLQEVQYLSGGGRTVPVVYGLGNLAFNSPGQFADAGIPPYGAAARLSLRADGSVAARLYPLFVDNVRSEYRTRPVSAAEFADARALLGAAAEAAPSGADAAGCFVELAVRGAA